MAKKLKPINDFDTSATVQPLVVRTVTEKGSVKISFPDKSAWQELCSNGQPRPFPRFKHPFTAEQMISPADIPAPNARRHEKFTKG